MPPGDPPLQDTALRFRQDCEQLLAKHSLLGVARGEYPPRALAVEENFPLEVLPPLDPSTATAKDMTYRMQLEIRNRRNDQLRLTYLMADRTEVFTAIYECARKHHAAFAKDLIAWCDLTASGFEEYRDGPRAWLLLLRELAGKGERSKSDKTHYVTAWKVQQDSKLPDHCMPADFEAKARAYYETIIPNLPFEIQPRDVMEAIVDMIPSTHLGGDRRRLKAQFLADGTFSNYYEVMCECRKVVEDDKKTGTKAVTTLSHAAAVGLDIDLSAMATLAKTTGMSIVVQGQGGGGTTLGALGAAFTAIDKLKQLGCPHPNCKFGESCNLNLAFGGPVNANLWIVKAKREKMLKDRAEWANKNNVTPVKIIGPSKSEQDAAKKRQEERRAKGGKKPGGDKPGGDGAPPAVPGGLAAFPDAIQDLDDPNFGANVANMALSLPSGHVGKFAALTALGGAFDVDAAFIAACEQRDAVALNQLVAAHGPPTCTLPIPEMSAKTPWDRDVLAGRKTVEGRVLRWRRRGKWTTNRKVEAIAPPGTWFQWWTTDTWFVLVTDEVTTGSSFGEGWETYGDSLVAPATAQKLLGRPVASAADADELYQKFYPHDPLFDPKSGESNIEAAFITFRVVAVTYDRWAAAPRRPDVRFPNDGLTPSHSAFMAMPAEPGGGQHDINDDDDDENDDGMPTLVEDESEGESEGDDDDEPPPRQWCVLDFSDARQAHLVCISADQPTAHSDLAHAVLELNLGENPYSTHCFGFEQEHEARALVATLEQGYAAAAAYEPIHSPDLQRMGAAPHATPCAGCGKPLGVVTCSDCGAACGCDTPMCKSNRDCTVCAPSAIIPNLPFEIQPRDVMEAIVDMIPSTHLGGVTGAEAGRIAR